MAQGAAAERSELSRAGRGHAHAGAAHGLRRGAVPQHRRLLGAQDGDVPDPGKRLHAALRVLRDRARASHRARRAGAGAGRRRGGPDGSQARGGHLRRSRRSQGRRRGDVRPDDPPHPGARGGVLRGSPDPGLQGRRGGPPHRAGGRARDPQPQHRDGAAAVPRRAAGRQLPPLARAARAREDLGPPGTDEERHDGRARGDGRGSPRDDARPARGFVRHPDDRSIPESRQGLCADRALLPPGRVRRAQARGAPDGLSPRGIRPARAQQLPRGRAGGRGGGPRPRGKAGRLAGVAPRETHSRGAAGPRNAAAGFLDTPGRESYGMGDAAGRAVRRTRVEGQMATSGTTQTRTTPPVLNATQMERYARQLILEEVGIRGQARLLRAKVLAIGAGGLGSPVALYLAAAGVGTIGIVDGDRVDLSNLHRQILHTTQAVGQDKTVSAQRTLAGVNPEVTVVPYQTVLTSANALDIIREYDVVVNGSDNFPTRYLVNDACVLLGKPLVDASILKWEAQATTFLPGRGCYRCLFPTPPPPGAVPSCAEGGILGALCGFAGARQALEVLKIVLGVGETLANKLLIFDALEGETRVVRWSRSPECPICGDHPTIHELIDYEQFCGMPAHDRSAAAVGPIPEITPEEAQALLANGAVQLIDVREPWEYEDAHIPGCRLIPMAEVPSRLREIDADNPAIIYCRSGGRSGKIVTMLRSAGYGKAVNLRGGILAWLNARIPT